MAYQINCECGYTVKGDSEDDLVANAEQHIQSDHPDMVGKVTRDDLLAQAEQV
jgi:predicted small metal-binding protein